MIKKTRKTGAFAPVNPVETLNWDKNKNKKNVDRKKGSEVMPQKYITHHPKHNTFTPIALL